MSLKERLDQLRGQGGGEWSRSSDRASVGERVARLRGHGPRGEAARGGKADQPAGPVDLAGALEGTPVTDGVVRSEFREPGPGRIPPMLAGWPEAEGVNPERALFLDTETTGLAGGTGTVAFMVGVARLRGDELTITQWTLTGMAGEGGLLAELARLVEGVEAVVTYNGKRFDGPLLATRFRLHGLADPLAALPHLDLLYPVRRLYGSRWPDCRLATAERRLLGRGRAGDLPGSEAPQAWRDFLRTGRPGRLPEVARHNRCDLASLAALLPVLAEGHRQPGPVGADPLAAARTRLENGHEAEARALLMEHAGQLGRQGRLELARLHRRAGDPEAARALWEDQARRGCPQATEHLAKHYEHRLRDIPQALAWAERLPPGPEHEHRRQRLRAKMAGGSPA